MSIKEYDSKEMEKFIAHLKSKGFERIGNGLSRIGFQRGKVVIKVPRSQDGMKDNHLEHATYVQSKGLATNNGSCGIRSIVPQEMPVAPCHLMSNGCLMMPLVDRSLRYEDLPLWAQGIDGGQVGFYKGKLVAFDYAHNAPLRYTSKEYYGNQ